MQDVTKEHKTMFTADLTFHAWKKWKKKTKNKKNTDPTSYKKPFDNPQEFWENSLRTAEI